MKTKDRHKMRLRRLGIDTYQEPVIYMRYDCHVCRSEGFEAQSRIQVTFQDRTIIATLNTISNHILEPGEAGLSEAAWKMLSPKERDWCYLSHPPLLESLSHVRAKVFGQPIDHRAMEEIVRDIAAGRYSDVHLAAFITACAGDRLSISEMVSLTRAMIGVGEQLQWGAGPVMDKHCVGGLPGNRTTLLVVPIVTAAGLLMPKTSSRAITSPAGTVDTMETLAPVNLDLKAMRRVVEREGGCVVWGGAVRLSPADDILIRVERPLDLDSPEQIVPSILSKKAAAGSTHVVIDIPVGPTAKVRTHKAAEELRQRLYHVGREVGLTVRALITDGAQPVGRGIGPALEAKDVLAVLKNENDAPGDLKARALFLSGEILELSGNVPEGKGEAIAAKILESGGAWKKFEAICEAQGGLRKPKPASRKRVISSPRKGIVTAIENRRLARTAKLSGAPHAPGAGVELMTPIGTKVEKGDPLFTIYAENQGELDYAGEYVKSQKEIIRIEEEV